MTLVDDVFKAIESGTHPFDAIKDLKEADLGIFLSLQHRELGKKYRRFSELKCDYCNTNARDSSNFPYDFFRYKGRSLHTSCLHDWIIAEKILLVERDIRFLARIHGHIYNGSTRGAYCPEEMEILNHFKLDKL